MAIPEIMAKKKTKIYEPIMEKKFLIPLIIFKTNTSRFTI